MSKPETGGGSYAIAVFECECAYAGRVEYDGDILVIRDASQIRDWGTLLELCQLAREGPDARTKLDPPGTLRAQLKSLISILDTDESLWRKS